MAGEKKRTGIINGKSIVLAILLILVVAGFYMVASNKPSVKKDDEYTILKEKNLAESYPETPREVVKLYGRYAKCIYKKGLSDKQVETMVNQMRNLFATELLNENALEAQLQDLDYEMKTFHKDGKSLINYEVPSDSLTTAKVDGIETASVVLSLSIKKDKSYTRTNELFLLRQDYQGNWKIVGWQPVKDKTESKDKKTA